MQDIQDWYISDRLKIRYMISPRKAPSDRVLIWFGKPRNVLGIKYRTRLFFKDLDISSIVWIEERNPITWGNNIDIEKICETVTPLIKDKELLFFGNSMGGFYSILFSKYLKPTKVLALNPQYSIHPDIVGKEVYDRWEEFHKGSIKGSIKEFKFKYKDLSNSFMPNINYTIMFGTDSLEEIHIKLFEKHTNIQIIKFLSNHRSHKVEEYLNKLHLYRPTMISFYNGKSLEELYARKSIKTRGVKC